MKEDEAKDIEMQRYDDKMIQEPEFTDSYELRATTQDIASARH